MNNINSKTTSLLLILVMIMGIVPALMLFNMIGGFKDPAAASTRIRNIATHYSGYIINSLQDSLLVIKLRNDCPSYDIGKGNTKHNNACAVDYVERGNVKLKLGRVKKSIDNFNLAIQWQPDYVPAYTSRGNARVQQRDIRAAIKDFNKAIQLEPSGAKNYFNRAFATNLERRPRKAMADFNQAIILNPNYARAYHNRGKAKWRLGQLQAAIEDFTKTIALQANHAAAHANRGRIRASLDLNAEALEDYRQAIKLHPGRYITELAGPVEILKTKLEQVQ